MSTGTLGIIPVLGLKIRDEREVDVLNRRLSAMEKMGVWIQLESSWEVYSDVGVGEITDAFTENDVNLASIKFEYKGVFDPEIFEKIASIADEAAGRTIIVSGPLQVSLPDIEKIYEIAAMYKVKVLFEPQTVNGYRPVYAMLTRFIGGVLGLSMVQEVYSSTEHFTSSISRYLQITKNLVISNYKGDKPAPLLIPSEYNNPKLLRFLVKNGYEGFLTVFYGKHTVDDRWLLRELLGLKEQLSALEEKEP